LPPGITSCPFRGLFYVDWICRNALSFNQTTHLYNPFNEDKPVKIARDGQVSILLNQAPFKVCESPSGFSKEIDPRVGEQLCRLFPPDDSVDLIPLLKRMKKQTQHRPKKHHSRGPFLDFDKVDARLSPRNDYRLHSSSNQMPTIKYD